jgi:hypothetical protein
VATPDPFRLLALPPFSETIVEPTVSINVTPPVGTVEVVVVSLTVAVMFTVPPESIVVGVALTDVLVLSPVADVLNGLLVACSDSAMLSSVTL